MPKTSLAQARAGGASTRTRWLVVGAVGAAIMLAAYLWPTGEERRVRARLDAIADALNTPAREPDMARLARLGRLRGYLTDDAVIYFEKDERQPVRGRDEIVGMVATGLPQFGAVRVELRDIRIAVRDDRAVADANLVARLIALEPGANPPTIAARSLGVTLMKIDTAWRVSSVRVAPQDDALRMP